MSKNAKIILGVIVVLFIAVLIWFGKMNSKGAVVYETEKPFKANITKKTVATGKVTPLEEIAIKPPVKKTFMITLIDDKPKTLLNQVSKGLEKTSSRAIMSRTKPANNHFFNQEGRPKEM